MNPQIEDSQIELLGTLGGHDVFRRGCVLFVVPRLPDDAPTEIKNAMMRRREAQLRGVCACGARVEVLSPTNVAMLHEFECSASDDSLGEIAKRCGWEWRWQI